MLLSHSLQPDYDPDAATRIFSEGLRQSLLCPELITDLVSTLKSAKGNTKQRLLSALDYDLVRDGNMKVRFEESFESEVLACLDHEDDETQDAALSLLRSVGKRVGPSVRAVDAVIAVCVDRNRKTGIRLFGLGTLAVYAIEGHNKEGLEAIALVARDSTENDDLRVEAIRFYFGASDDRVKRQALESALDREGNPRIAQALDDYVDGRLDAVTGSSRSNIQPVTHLPEQ